MRSSKDVADEIVAQLKERQAELGYSQSEVAHRCGLEQGTVSSFFRRRYDGFHISTAHVIATALDAELHVAVVAKKPAPPTQ